MKYLLLALSLLFLAGCQDSDPNTGAKDGYVAGYQLTCGLSWSADNRFVVDKEFARDFLDGAIVCAREHPERARRVLGLAKREQTALATETDTAMNAASKTGAQPTSLAEEAPKPKESPASIRRHVNATRASAKTAKARPKPTKPSKTSSRARTASVKKKAPANATKARAKKTRAPAKAAKAPAKSTKAPAITNRAPVKPEDSEAAGPTARSVAAPARAPDAHVPSVENTSGKRQRRKGQISDYERFMGR